MLKFMVVLVLGLMFAMSADAQSSNVYCKFERAIVTSHVGIYGPSERPDSLKFRRATLDAYLIGDGWFFNDVTCQCLGPACSYAGNDLFISRSGSSGSGYACIDNSGTVDFTPGSIQIDERFRASQIELSAQICRADNPNGDSLQSDKRSGGPRVLSNGKGFENLRDFKF